MFTFPAAVLTCHFRRIESHVLPISGRYCECGFRAIEGIGNLQGIRGVGDVPDYGIAVAPVNVDHSIIIRRKIEIKLILMKFKFSLIGYADIVECRSEKSSRI